MKDKNIPTAYMRSVEEILSDLETKKEGLSKSEAAKRLDAYGRNDLEGGQGTPKFLLFLSQFKDVLMILLLVAAGLSFAIGNLADAGIMLVIAMLNAMIGFFQEYKAEQIMQSLKKLVQSPSKVLRSGELSELDQSLLVPGDIVRLEEGDKVPADLRILEAFNLRTNDVSLTGESMPQEKNNNIIETEVPLGDRDNMVYLGTNVATGGATGVVVATGMQTEMGQIATMTQEADTSRSPLQQELQVVANKIAVLAVFVSLGLFGVSLYQGYGMNFALVYALGVAVAVVPQALPMQVTVALSQGVDRLSKRNAVVKQLNAVETLGSTNVVATDKTGTLTKNEMTVTHVWFDEKEYKVTGLGYEPEGGLIGPDGAMVTQEIIDTMEILFDAATMASNAEIHAPDDKHEGWYAIGDPTEAALVTLSTKLGTRSQKEDEENPEVHELSFDSDRKRMSSVRAFPDSHVLKMKGATDSILSIAKYKYSGGEEVSITEGDKEAIRKRAEGYARDAKRVLTIAYRKLDENEKDYTIEKTERDVVFLGLIAMIDPPKEGVREAMDEAHAAGIATFIMTGDHAITAEAIGREVNLASADEHVPVLTSLELGAMSDEKLSTVMATNKSLIFSRVSPADKLRIVKLLKKQGRIVAVTGDGVNDAPALKSAHIGVAMGQMGTDVSKEASELILLDDSYSTLVHAIREGRTIYANLKKTVLASMTSNAGELTIVLLGLLFGALKGWPVPILAVQILSVDLLAEILPLTALTFDPGSENLMSSPPRDKEEHIIGRFDFVEILFFGFLMGTLAFINFAFFGQQNGELSQGTSLYQQATTVSYLTIAVTQWLNTLSRRYPYKSLFNSTLWNNKRMLQAIGLSVVVVLIVVYTPSIGSFLGFEAVGIGAWMQVLAAGMVFLLAQEVLKSIKRRKTIRK